MPSAEHEARIWQWAVPQVWTCPRCGWRILTTEAGRRCLRCEFCEDD